MRLIRLAGALLLLAAAVAGFVIVRLGHPYARFNGEVFVDIPRGTGSGAIADLLVHEGVVASRWEFLAARLLNRGRVLQAGEYRFTKPATPLDVFDRIARGDTFYYELVVPEGKNIFDISVLAGELGLFPAAQFLTAARNPSMIRDLDPHAPSLEGYLFPNTYRLTRGTTPDKLCRVMTGKFREVWRGLKTDAGVHRTITLASLVEKEGKHAAERPVIAAVFVNRLNIGMKLDCDPTTIYAALLQDRYRGTIYRSDLDSSHPYNTYKNAGLPPGPIANPGLASIEAALHPAASDAIYFVALPDGSGRHSFHKDIAGHQEAVAAYRRGQHH